MEKKLHEVTPLENFFQMNIDQFDLVKCNVFFYSNKHVILLNFPSSSNKNVNQEIIIGSHKKQSEHHKILSVYKYKNDKLPTTGFLTLHSVLSYNNCESKVFINSCRTEYKGYNDKNLSIVLKELLNQNFKIHSFQINSLQNQNQYDIISAFILDSKVSHEISKGNLYKNLEMFLVVKDLPSKVMKSYVMSYNKKIKQMLVENKTNRIPDWLVKDMESWLMGKEDTFETLLDMISNYQMCPFKKDASRYPGSTWDKNSNNVPLDNNQIKYIFNSF